MKVSPTNEFDPGIGGGGLSERPQVGPVKHRADSEMKMQNLSVTSFKARPGCIGMRDHAT